MFDIKAILLVIYINLKQYKAHNCVTIYIYKTFSSFLTEAAIEKNLTFNLQKAFYENYYSIEI